ncbi:MAG TPA: hypothetical protein PKI13_02115 [Bacteroidaceae bacterium]|jgi:hypothetical protein|nr:hypothetical protein [Bacteroidaceae bacterium]HOD68199.1 hypothetical protein [Bacteroidaceae bacterium]HQL26085.1 hypothetical protein [Bacteroidaceae bacterium]
MNIKQKLIIISILICLRGILPAQEIRLPLEVQSGHLYSDWKLNNSIQTRVMLETGFPKIVISENYALTHLKGLAEFENASENTYISLWGQTDKTRVSYLIRDTLQFSGMSLFVDALVADVSDMTSWKDLDMVVPLKDLPGITEINIGDRYMLIDIKPEELNEGYEVFKVEYDDNVKGLFLTSTLTVYDSLKTEEKLTGNFLLDLGAPNAVFVNRDLVEVEEFVMRSERMLLKDTTMFKPNPATKLAVIMPYEFRIANISCKEEFIVAMKMLGRNSQKYSGIIGNRFFSHFAVAFDFINNNLYMKPKSDKVEIK